MASETVASHLQSKGAKLNRSLSKTLAASSLIFALAAITIERGYGQNQVTIANQPASQGRPITPAGSLILDATTGLPAVGSLPVTFVRTPDHAAKDGAGRFLIAVNSGYGIQFSASTNEGQQSLSVIDLAAEPAPKVIQNVYFPSPQSANIGAVFTPQTAPDGSYALYVSGGYENKIWIFRFNPKSRQPISPASPGPDTKVTAPFISVAGLTSQAGSPRYQNGVEPVYPSGLAISPDGETLFVANNLGDSLGIIQNLRFERRLLRVDLGDGHVGHFVYPYGVVAFSTPGAYETQKVYVSCWATASVAVKDLSHPDGLVTSIPVGRHPTEMILNAARNRLYVANSDADSVSVIDTARDRVVETISVRLQEKALRGGSPEGLALSPDGERSTSQTLIATLLQSCRCHPPRWARVRTKATAASPRKTKMTTIMTAKPLAAALCAASFPPANIPPLSQSPTEPSSWATGRELASRIPRSW